MKKIFKLFFVLSLFLTFTSAYAQIAEKESDCDQILEGKKKGKPAIKEGDYKIDVNDPESINK